jgi:cytochrome P450
VLVGPNEVSLSDVSNVKDIYGLHTTFMKAPIYSHMTLTPDGVFSVRDKTAHSQRRRLLSHAFAQSNVLECEPLIMHHISKLIMAVDKRAGDPLDMLTWFRLVAFDIVGTKPLEHLELHIEEILTYRHRRALPRTVFWRS